MSGTVISEPFGIAEVEFIDVDWYGSEPHRWAIGRHIPSHTGEGPQAFVRRWLYVFQHVGTTTELFAEHYADDEGTLWALGGDVARNTELHERPSPSSTSSDRLTVPIEVLGQKALTWCLASSVRLSPSAIRALEQNRPGFCEELDLRGLEDKKGVWFTHVAVKEGETTRSEPFVKVVDPVVIADALAARYAWAANNVVRWVATYPGLSPADRAWIERREARYLICKMLLKVIKDDPEDQLSLLGELEGPATNPTYQMQVDVQAYELEREELLRERDKRSLALIHFLQTSCMGILERSHREYPGTDQYFAGEWLAHTARWLPRLIETGPGKTYLAEQLAEPKSMINQFVLVQEAPPSEVFGVARKQAQAVFALWETIAPVAEKLQSMTRPTECFRSINLLYAETILLSKATFETVILRRHSSTNSLGVKNEYLQITVGPRAQQVLQGTGVTVGRVAKALEVVNLSLAIQGLVEHLEKEDPELRESLATTANLIGSLADFGGAFYGQLTEALGKTAGRGPAWLSLVGAVMDLACATDAAVTAFQTDDYNHMVGHGIVAAGATLSAIGAIIWLSAAGTAPVAPPLAGALAIVGAIVSAAGWMWAILSKDTALEQFVKHCEYGVAYGSGSAAPSWALGPFSEWKTAPDGRKRQLVALHHLLAAFTMRYADFAGVTIHPSMTSSTSTFVVVFELTYRTDDQEGPKKKQTPSYLVDWNRREVTHRSSGTVVDDTVARFGLDAEGRRFVTITHPMPRSGSTGSEKPPPQVDLNDYDWAEGERPARLATYDLPRTAPICLATVQVHLDLRGDGKLLVPVNEPASMQLFMANTADGGWGNPNDDVVSSKDE